MCNFFPFIFQLIYKADFFKMQGHLISLPYTPQVVHCRYVGDITSDVCKDILHLNVMGQTLFPFTPVQMSMGEEFDLAFKLYKS